jgi:hypothetical protein
MRDQDQDQAQEQAQDQDSIPHAQAQYPAAEPEPSPYDIFPNHRSYVVAGVVLSESALIDPANSLVSSTSQAYSITRLYGTLNLSRIDRRYHTDLDYKGGALFYNNSGASSSATQVQQLTASEGISWRRTRLLIEDSLSDFPGAIFGSSAFGGASSYTLGFGTGSQGGISDFFGFNDYGGFGAAPHFTNVSLVEATEQLTPRSGITVAGAYAITDYLGHGNSINSQQTSALVGYSRVLSPRSTAFISYGYQDWKYPGGGRSTAHTVQASYQRTLTHRLGFGLGAGPEFISSTSTSEIVLGPFTLPVTITSHQTGFSTFASLSYALRTSSLGLTYQHLVTGGSGLYAGASTDVAIFTVTRPLSRRWAANYSAGFSRLNSLGNSSAGTSGDSFDYGFAGVGVRRSFGRHLTFIASYQFAAETSGYSCTGSSCPGLTQQHEALISFTWRTAPLRIGRENYRDPGTGTTENQPDDIKDSQPPPL